MNRRNENIDALLLSAIEKAKENIPPKNLTRALLDNWDTIQSAIESGIKFKQIADNMGYDYNYFMTYYYRAKNKIEKIGKTNTKSEIMRHGSNTIGDAKQNKFFTKIRSESNSVDNNSGDKTFDLTTLEGRMAAQEAKFNKSFFNKN